MAGGVQGTEQAGVSTRYMGTVDRAFLHRAYPGSTVASLRRVA